MLKYERIARRSLRAQVETARDDAGDEPPCIWLLSANPAYGPTYVYCLQGQSQGERFARHWYELVRCAAERELYAARRAAGLCGRCGGQAFEEPRSATPAPRSGMDGIGRRRTPPAGGATPTCAPGDFASTAESPRRGRRGANPAHTAPTPIRANIAACPPTRHATPWSNSPPARTWAPGTPGRKSPCASPSPGYHARRSKSSPTHRRWRPSPPGKRREHGHRPARHQWPFVEDESGKAPGKGPVGERETVSRSRCRGRHSRGGWLCMRTLRH